MQEAWTTDDTSKDEKLVNRGAAAFDEYQDELEEIKSAQPRGKWNKNQPKAMTEGEIKFENRLKAEKKTYKVPKNYTSLNTEVKISNKEALGLDVEDESFKLALLAS